MSKLAQIAQGIVKTEVKIALERRVAESVAKVMDLEQTKRTISELVAAELSQAVAELVKQPPAYTAGDQTRPVNIG